MTDIVPLPSQQCLIKLFRYQYAGVLFHNGTLTSLLGLKYTPEALHMIGTNLQFL